MFCAGENFPTENNEHQGLINEPSKETPQEGAQNVFSYRELGFAEDSGQTCPTCGGSGRLNREQERELVALIPVRDRRLRPRRTVLYLIIAVIICLALCTVAVVLLFPRDITITLKAVKAVNITIPPVNHSEPFIILKTTVEIHNSNYFKATAKNFTVEVTWDDYVVAQSSFHGTRSVPAHASAKYDLLVRTEYHKAEASKLRRVCCSTWSYNLAFIIKTTVQADSLTTSTQASDSGYRYVNCEDGTPNWWWSTCFRQQLLEPK